MKTRLQGIAVLVCGLTVWTPAIPFADDAAMKVDPPAVYKDLRWVGPTRSADGWWYTQEQISKVDLRLKYLENEAARQCVDSMITQSKAINPWIKIATGVVTGAAIGFCVGHSSHCGIVK